MLDSDEDGATDGDEFGDPCCDWKNGGTSKNEQSHFSWS